MIDADLDRTGTVLFENAAWRLLPDGLEHRDTGYFIEADLLGRRRDDGLWDWPMHLAEKRWCAPRLFREAFLAALDAFGVVRDAALARSFVAGFGALAGQGRTATSTEFVALGEVFARKPSARRPAMPVPGPAARRGLDPAGLRVPAGA
jgi:hypothetical protein